MTLFCRLSKFTTPALAVAAAFLISCGGNPGTTSRPATGTASKKSGRVASISFSEYSRKDCDHRDLNRKHPENIVYWADTLCSDISIKLAQIIYPVKKTEQAINSAILRRATNSSRQSVNEYLDSLIHARKTEFYQLSTTCSVINNDPAVLVIRVDNNEFTGGAHPVNYYDFLNFDLSSGREIKAPDILLPGFEAALRPVVKKMLEEQYRPDSVPFLGEFKLNGNIAINKDGLLLGFRQYEILPYAFGEPQVLLPYDKIRKWIRPGSVIAGNK